MKINDNVCKRLKNAAKTAESIRSKSMANDLPDKEVLCRMFTYDPHTGVLTHNIASVNSHRKIGDAVHTLVKGYFITRLFGVQRYAHRIIWKMMTGKEALVVDHINRNKTDNRWVNLRDVSVMQNSMNRDYISKNNVSGIKGVYWDKEHLKWRVKICIGYKLQHVGRFDTLEEAAEAYIQAAAIHHRLARVEQETNA